MTNYNKSKGILARPAQKLAPLTDEQRKEQLIRAAAQKYNSLVEGIIFNAVQGAGADLNKETADTIYENARHIANRYLEDLMGVKLGKKEEAK